MKKHSSGAHHCRYRPIWLIAYLCSSINRLKYVSRFVVKDIHIILLSLFRPINKMEDTVCLLKSKVKRTRIKAMNSKGRFPISS